MQQIHSSGNTLADTVVDIWHLIQLYSSRQIHSSTYEPLLIHSGKYTAVANPGIQGRYGRVTEIHQWIYSSRYSGGYTVADIRGRYTLTDTLTVTQQQTFSG
jgi:hypothetical protein